LSLFLDCQPDTMFKRSGCGVSALCGVLVYSSVVVVIINVYVLFVDVSTEVVV